MQTTKHITASLIAALFFTFSACSEMDENTATASGKVDAENLMRENGNNPDELVFTRPLKLHTNYIYLESNELGTNTILIYKKEGREDLRLINTVASGGSGNSLMLDSYGAIAIDQYHEYLYAVNTRSNSISAFEIKPDGNLELKQTISSGGVTPVSLAIYDHYLYVLNSGSSTLNGFALGHNGTFAPISGSRKTLSSKNSGAAKISFSPSGNYLFVTEKATNSITLFPITFGVAGEMISMSSIGKTPCGFAFARDQYMIVSNAEMGLPNASTVTSYRGIETAHLSSANGVLQSDQTSGCDVAMTEFGRFAFVTNSGTNTLSAYYVSEDGNLYNTDTETLSGDTPTDVVVGSDNYTVYVLCEKDNTIHQFQRTERGGLLHIGVLTGTSRYATGMAGW